MDCESHMLYETERDLQLEISKIDLNLFDTYPVSFVRREVHVGGCIPDLVMVYFGQDPAYNIWPRTWSYRYSYVIWLLRERGVLSKEEIASLLYAPIENIAHIIHDLTTKDIIIENDEGNLLLADYVKNIKAEVVAIEAKLRDWKEALSQAVRYKEFANISIVAMDASMVPKSNDARNEFINNQVGLWAVSPGIVEWLIYPTMREYGIGHEKEHIVMSTIIPTTQTFWSRRNRRRASNHD